MLSREYARLTRPPFNLRSEEMLSALVERLLKAMRKIHPTTVRQFFALVNQHMRWELNDLARRLDELSRRVGFRITLPVTAPAASEAPASAPRSSIRHAGRGRRALVVDDEESVRDVLIRTLAHHAYEVDAVADAEAALARIRENRYDVVLTDVFMPGELNGLGLFDLLCEEQPAVARRMIFLTGNAVSDRVADRVLDHGIRCIEKPFDIHELARTVNEVARAEASDEA